MTIAEELIITTNEGKPPENEFALDEGTIIEEETSIGEGFVATKKGIGAAI